jgi:hypothetical protein
MLVESLQQTVDLFNADISNLTPLKGKWNFNYGKEHWQNLGDYVLDADLPFADRQKYLLLIWKDRGFSIDTNGSVKGYQFDGEMILLVRSKISDPTYQYKYDVHIKNLEALTERLYNAFSDCEGWLIKSWKETEVSNEFDTNLDGLKIRFTIEFSE